jgi:hypothetical protein
MPKNDDEQRIFDIRDYVSDRKIPKILKIPEISFIPKIDDYKPTGRTLFYELKKKEVVEEGFKRFIYELIDIV